MATNIQARGFRLTHALRRYVLRRANHMRDGQHEHIGKLEVRLSDINGPRGGADKCCRVLIRTRRMPEVVVEDTQPDMYDAIDQAFRKAAHTLGRRLARHRTRSLQRRQYAGRFSRELVNEAC